MIDLYCLTYEIDKSVKAYRAVKWFRITNVKRDIIEELNMIRKGYKHRGFAYCYEAQDYIFNLLDFEDRFRYRISTPYEIQLNRCYFRDKDN